QQLEEETPRLESLSVSDNKGLKRKRVGQDMFTQECVKEWQSPRIKAWEARHSAPDSYYYRFVVPGEGQQNGAWSAEEHKLFMQRYHEWMTKGYKIGNAWGVFSMGIPHRVGYQCMNYYRKLVSDGKLKDESYTIINGKLKQVVKDKAFGSHVLISDLGPAWQDEDVKQQEKQVDQWIKEFHGSKLSARPVSKPK
ncbi:uncharacterized protein B0P05DRAFT_447743, partial [Gilbertella persicaria]|uniref:uncharacterized protein n=1 Tax=Gilbertella persicaria TaxID=101096 RepID=UPI00221E5742